MSSPRALLLDIGNTRLKWGVLHGTELRRTGNITHDKIREAGIASLTTRLPRKVDQIYACNVAGNSIATRMSGVLGIHCNSDIHFVHAQRSGFGLTNCYPQPRRLGDDRWVAMIGAYAELKAALCVVDAGTAVTIDAVDRSGKHLGGQIIPGLSLMGNALAAETREIGTSRQSKGGAGTGMALFGNNTDAAIRNGAISAVCGAIEAATRRMRAAGYRPKIVLTGGDASRILKQADVKFLHRPNLVLLGLAFMLQSDS